MPWPHDTTHPATFLLLLSFLLLVTLQATGSVPHVHASTATLRVSPDGTQVSATFARTPLWQVLEMLGGPLKFRAHVDPTLAPLPVTETWTHVPVDQVLDRLLTGTNYAWIGREVYVWPREEHPKARLLETDQWPMVSTHAPIVHTPPDLEALHTTATEAVDPEDRFTALTTLLEHGDQETVESALEIALNDEEPEIRAFALEALEDGKDRRSNRR